MSDTELEWTRFEELMSRFFDGLLSEEEDRELQAHLKANTDCAESFLSQVRIERAVAGLSAEPISHALFATAVRRSVGLLDDRVETGRFAHEVVQMVHVGSASRQSIRRIRRSVRQKTVVMPEWAVLGAACAAMLFLALLLTGGGGEPSRPSHTRQVAHVTPASAPVIPNRDVVAPKAVAGDSVRPKEEARIISALEEAVSVSQQPAPASASSDFEVLQEYPRAPKSEIAAAPPPRQAPSVALAELEWNLGKLLQLSGSRALWNRARVPELSANARPGEVGHPGDLLTVFSSDPGSGFVSTNAKGAELALENGATVWLSPGSSLRFEGTNGTPSPILERGEVSVRLQEQPGAREWLLKVKDGPEISATAAAFRLSAKELNRRVAVFVDEGKVLFRCNGVERIVAAHQVCQVDAGRSPELPRAFKPDGSDAAPGDASGGGTADQAGAAGEAPPGSGNDGTGGKGGASAGGAKSGGQGAGGSAKGGGGAKGGGASAGGGGAGKGGGGAAGGAGGGKGGGKGVGGPK